MILLTINMKRKKLILSIALSFIFTLIIRFTLYVEDCNLLVLSGTFIIIFFIVYTFIHLIIKFLSPRGKKTTS